MRHASSVINRSIARKYFGKDAQNIGRSDFRKLLRRWKSPQRLLQSGEGRKALLYFLGRPCMLGSLAMEDFRFLVLPIDHAATSVLKDGGPRDLYQLAVVANVVSHELEERSGEFSQEARVVSWTKRQLLRHLAHTFPDDIVCIHDPLRSGVIVLRLRHVDHVGLHILRRDLPPGTPILMQRRQQSA